MTGPLRQTPKGLFLHIRATPKASRDEVTGVSADALTVKVTAVPDKGKANEAVIEILAKTMRVAKSSFELVSGATSRQKVLRITSNESAIANWLMDFHNNLK